VKTLPEEEQAAFYATLRRIREAGQQVRMAQTRAIIAARMPDTGLATDETP